MNSDQLQPERYNRPRRTRQDFEPSGISGRVWVKRDLEFWHRCSVEYEDASGVLVSFDNMEELTVSPKDLQELQLEPGDLVFTHHWEGSISGSPAFVVSVKGEAAIVEYPDFIYGKTECATYFLRELRFYFNLTPTVWKKGTRVFAYKRIQFDPPLFLLFPAIVEGMILDLCVHVEFDDGESAVVPTTLVEKRELAPGDMVHTCTTFHTHGIRPVEQWTPCRVVERRGENLLLRSESGSLFESPMNMIAVLPMGYRMLDGKFEKIGNAPGVDQKSDLAESSIVQCVHIVRTEKWTDAWSNPISKHHVDALIASDRELAWSPDEWDGYSPDESLVNRYYAIIWKGQPCFGWYRNEIRCMCPNASQIAKMIEIAISLDANVVGDDGREYH